MKSGLFIAFCFLLTGCGKQQTGLQGSSGNAYQVEIPLAYPARLVAEIEELDEVLHPEEKVLGNCGNGIRKQYRSLIYEDGKGSRVSLDIKGMGNPDGYGDAFFYKRDPKNPQNFLLMSHIFTEGDSYYLAKWVVRGTTYERVALSDDPKLQAGEARASWSVADKRVPVTLRSEFLADESFYPLRFLPGQVFTNMIRVKLDIPPNSPSLKYRFEVRVPKNVRLDEEGQSTRKIRLRASLATEDHSSRSIFDHQVPISAEWTPVTGSFALSQDQIRELYIEPYGIFGFPEYRNLELSLSR